MADYNRVYIPAPNTSTVAHKLPDLIPQLEPQTGKKTVSEQQPVHRTKSIPLWVSVAAVVFACAIAFVMAASVIAVNKTIVDNKKEISRLNNAMAQAQSENVRLKASLGALVSADKIQDYAVSVLGMQKAERYQIHYFDDRDGDRVVISDGKVLNADTQE